MSRGPEADYDVIVCGGGAAGVGAAIGAAKAGAKVCLVEKYGFLGGAATAAQVLAYCGMFQQGRTPVQAVGGVGHEVLEQLRVHGLDGTAHRSPTTGNWIVLLDSEVLKYTLDQLVMCYGVDVKLHTRLAAVTRTGARLEGVTMAGMAGRHHVVSEAFVDASGDANLAMLAGLDCTTGDAEGQLQALSMPLRIGGLSPDIEIDRDRLIDAIGRYNRDGRFPIPREDGGIFTRLPLSGDMWWMIVDLDLPDLDSESFSRAEMTGRAMAQEYVALLRREMPGFGSAHLVATGPQVGVRETRHPAARHTLSGADVFEGRQYDTGLARAAWPSELHGAAGKPVYTPVGGPGYFQVPYDALRAAGIDNLWYGGRVIGADAEAYGSVRVMGTAFATGEAAGVAATDYADRNRQIDPAEVQARLRAQGALI